MGTAIGSLKRAAGKLGLSLPAYLLKIDGGLLWCWKCQRWQPATEFGVDRKRPNGRAGRCLVSRRVVNGKG
jgi:hypothetical protein